MPHSTPQTNTRYLNSLILLCILTISAGSIPADPADHKQAAENMTADCRLEGEAGGLRGADLDQFVEECVADLQSVEFSNTEE